jgi:hypothetical protein
MEPNEPNVNLTDSVQVGHNFIGPTTGDLIIHSGNNTVQCGECMMPLDSHNPGLYCFDKYCNAKFCANCESFYRQSRRERGQLPFCSVHYVSPNLDAIPMHALPSEPSGHFRGGHHSTESPSIESLIESFFDEDFSPVIASTEADVGEESFICLVCEGIITDRHSSCKKCELDLENWFEELLEDLQTFENPIKTPATPSLEAKPLEKPSKGDSSEALEERRTLDQALAWFNQGIQLIDTKKYRKALSRFDKALPAFAGDDGMIIRILNNRGNAYYLLEEYPKCVEAYYKAMLIRPTEVRGDTLYNMGTAYSMMGRYKDAIKCFEQAIPRGLSDEAVRSAKDQIRRCNILQKAVDKKKQKRERRRRR